MAENPLIVRIEAPALANELGATMNAIRSWLDSQKIQPTTFKIVTAGLIELTFRHDHQAARFRALFDGELA
jgi:hypothetical protein